MATLEAKLTEAAKDAFDNSQMFVVEIDTVLYLRRRTVPDGCHLAAGEKGYVSVRAIGIKKAGLRRLLAAVQKIAEDS